MSQQMTATQREERSLDIESIETAGAERASETAPDKQEAPEFTPFAWRMTVLSLALGALTLISIAAWVFAGIFRYQNMP